ncbi:sugar ABC transporter permease [Litorilinea aerophila]|uniref:Sugar ABC transporter permease n=1 Tax=Litorilinea aerophila TaxID=1204385 RepID=A0A540VC01_9CHLR|nr:sugar ABC transporter permease [Litorilinea aerophila]MCC9077863.1 sugar ABC transporter permease [Litorilinea aerophila]OUC08668.1 glycerol-3-phosphate ABC transporter permease [Litorilinea aerophila]
MVRSRRRITATERNEYLLFLLLVGPNLLLFGVFTYWPLFYNGYLSFVRWDMLAPIKIWVGLDNYRYLFTSPEFGTILWNTVVFTVSAVLLTCGIGLLMALLLNQPLRGRVAVRGIVFSPVMLSGAAIGIVWIYIFDPRYGLLDFFIRGVGLRSPNWLLDTSWAMTAVIIVHVWKTLGYAVVIYLAGLQAIPRELYEAALVDGAGTWARFRHVTLPGLSPVTFFLVITTVLAAFQSFDIIKVMTDGGPVNATTTLIYYLYEEGFVGFNAGRAGVAAVVLFLAMFVFTLVQMRYSERSVHYA